MLKIYISGEPFSSSKPQKFPHPLVSIHFLDLSIINLRNGKARLLGANRFIHYTREKFSRRGTSAFKVLDDL